jgi:hypothetical protein
MRIESHGNHTYAISNAPEDASLQFLAELLCDHYFVERVIQDSKDEVGADEFQAQKYVTWELHTALTACVLWFIATTSSIGPMIANATPNWLNNSNSKLCLLSRRLMCARCCGRFSPSHNCLLKKPKLKSSNISSIVLVQPPVACVSDARRRRPLNVTLSNYLLVEID